VVDGSADQLHGASLMQTLAEHSSMQQAFHQAVQQWVQWVRT